MSRTIVKDYGAAFTNPAGLPLVPPGAGVEGYTHRWRASLLAGLSGDAVASWASTVGSATLAQGTAGKRPLIYDDATLGRRLVRFDGTDDQMSVTATDMQTIALVFRLRGAYGAANQGLMGVASGGYYRGSDNKINGFYSSGIGSDPQQFNVDRGAEVDLTAGAGGAVANVVTSDDKFHTIVARSAGGHGSITPGLQGGSVYGPLDLLEVITWGSVLSDAQVVDILDAMRDLYGTALAYT